MLHCALISDVADSAYFQFDDFVDSGMFQPCLLVLVTALLGNKTFVGYVSRPGDCENLGSVHFQRKRLFCTLGVGTGLLTNFPGTRKRDQPIFRHKLVLLYLASLLLAGSPEPNPGPTQQDLCANESSHQWHCGTCDVTVQWKDRGVE